MTNSIGTMSLLCGFLIIFSGVYLLNYSGSDADGHKFSDERLDDETIVDTAEDVRTGLPLQDLPRFSDETQYGDRTGLMQSYGVRSNGYILRDLSRDGEEQVDENE